MSRPRRAPLPEEPARGTVRSIETTTPDGDGHDALRASDAEREATVALLRRHCGEGRLTVEELDERIGAALAARTVGELRALVRDLPPDPEPAPVPASPDHCEACGRVRGTAMACQFCHQVSGLPEGVVLSGSGRRLAGAVLDGTIMLCTAYVGWLLWAAFVFARGQTPGKQLLGMRCVKLRDNEVAGWGTMFLREVVGKLVVSMVAVVTLWLVYAWLLWDRNNQELWDKLAGTLVVTDHGRLGARELERGRRQSLGPGRPDFG